MMQGIRVGLLLVCCMMAAGWAGFLFATHRALHTMDWLPIAVLAGLVILMLRKARKGR